VHPRTSHEGGDGTRVAGAAAVLSFFHELLVELFRQRPALARELLAASAGLELAGATAERGSIDLTQVAPAEYRSDAVTVIRDRRGKASAAVIVEVQLKVDRDKRYTRPLYVTAARASLRCPVLLLVLAPRRAVARWARRSIATGHPGFWLRPIVIGFGEVPRITDEAVARGAPELSVLSAIARADAEVVQAALGAVQGLPEESKKLYWDFIMARWPELARQAMEARMIKGYQYQSDFARKYISLGRKQGLEKGRAKGREEGREEGLRRAIVDIVGARLPGLRDELAQRLRGRPAVLLDTIGVALGKANDEAEARAVLDRLLASGKPAGRVARRPSQRRAHPASSKPRARAR